ncbi:hypothetical protein HYALB_00003727 [Hymenoscyphus albidus]|uniref:Uncharacterized protein n=1 Tax=Hymenoscyphus albidus TaxID=595503 RepID=A0A9N9LYC1_9HELO|nr:hypothetical protein HYALB_00003727 [Hymenoscyphus albidus]
MSPLHRPGASNHQIPRQRERNNTTPLLNLLCNLKCPTKNPFFRYDLREGIGEERVRGGVHGSRSDEVERSREAYETREEEGRSCFHDDTPPREDEADFCARGDDADGAGEGHSNTHADGVAV